MVRLGRVVGHRMVDLQPRSKKLAARAVRIVQELTGLEAAAARRALTVAGGRVRVAVAAARRPRKP
jgi:N-acetylmuramic acid 6-phosphate etherase